MTLDVDDIVRRLNRALRVLTGCTLPSVGAYPLAKARAVGDYAARIADAWAAGAITEADMKRELDEIEMMARRFAGAMRGLPGGVLERAARGVSAEVLQAMAAGLDRAGRPLPAPLAERAALRLAA